TSFGLEPEPEEVGVADKSDEETSEEDSVHADAAVKTDPEVVSKSSGADENARGADEEQELGSALEAASTEDETAKAIDDLFANFQPSANEAEEILADVESVVEDESDSESSASDGEDDTQAPEAKKDASSGEQDDEPTSRSNDKEDRPKPSRKKRRGKKVEKEEVAETDDSDASEDSDAEKKRNIPTWGDTIDDLIESNIARHKNSSRGRGPSRRKG
ncbi:MAG: hypothetical protein MK322_13480, partial [Pseudomonadales bacterium]|nr:hypothetical protein [Pseudomonadales bacterium]